MLRSGWRCCKLDIQSLINELHIEVITAIITYYLNGNLNGTLIKGKIIDDNYNFI